MDGLAKVHFSWWPDPDIVPQLPSDTTLISLGIDMIKIKEMKIIKMANIKIRTCYNFLKLSHIH
jgi:hypothetical protein